MGWPFHSLRSSDADRVEEANRAIAAIFSPSHATLPDSTVKDLSPKGSSVCQETTQERRGDSRVGTLWLTSPQDSGVSCLKEGPKTVEMRGSDFRSSWMSSLFKYQEFFSKKKSQSVDSSHSLGVSSSLACDGTNNKLDVDPPGQACEVVEKETNKLTLDELPPCPIAGYQLDRKRGLVDIYKSPPHALSIKELHLLIIELSSIEQRSKNMVDYQFGPQMNSRGLRGMELLINPCILLTGLYFMTWRAARLWQSALPRNSFLLNGWLKLLCWHVPAEKQESLARQHRRLMQATNAHVSFSFIVGLFMVSVSWITWPSLNVMETSPEIVVGKQNVAYQQHSSASLKWLWFVYYNHPVYAPQAVSVLTPKLLQ
ncbi:unnamed protein product [Phytomonas sp. EM1]|nr:unnamed protein product [Phytomonas sp. EM1]|eukprot:CCW62629.1 unnamed protein product [Phytomonas sp. isolate EM1]